jgi:hypothetical protein
MYREEESDNIKHKMGNVEMKEVIFNKETGFCREEKCDTS